MEESEEQHSFLNKKNLNDKINSKVVPLFINSKVVSQTSNRLASKENFSSFSNNSI